jgi:hypothetical protein
MSRLSRASLAAAIAAAAVAVFVLPASAHRSASPVLVGTVGKDNAYKITLRTASGKLV